MTRGCLSGYNEHEQLNVRGLVYSGDTEKQGTLSFLFHFKICLQYA